MDADDLRIRVELIGDAALDLDSGPERARYIADACGADESLKERVLDYVRGGDDIQIVPLVRETSPSAHIGRQIDNWRLLRLLGEGGFGVVYLAERNDGQVRQTGAIKFLKGTVRSRELDQRFLDERQVLANLNHPWIVRLIDAGVSAERQAYLVMEYIEDATPIDVYCEQHGLGVSQRLKLFCKVCEAVAYAHRELVVHRDLKPANVLIAKDGTPRLMDFGVAKILDPVHRAGGRDAPSTQMVLGTERYFSPEQARGEPIGTASDVYSLGVILYELLVGVDPYDLARRARENIQRIICTVDPVPPSKALARVTDPTSAELPAAASRQRRRKQLEGDLDAILLQALRKERDRRYASVADFAEDLKRHLSHVPVKARIDTIGYRINRFVRRHRLQVITVMIVVVALLVGLGLAQYQRLHALRQAHIATARELSAHAVKMLPNDPERGLQLAMYAVEATVQFGEPAVPAAENALHQAVWLAHATRRLAKPAVEAAFSGDGRSAATLNADRIDVYDASSGDVKFSIHSELGSLRRVALDGELLAAASAEGVVQLWDNAGARLKVLDNGDAPIWRLALSPDGARLAVVGKRLCQVWDTKTGRQLFSVALKQQLSVEEEAPGVEATWSTATGAGNSASHLLLNDTGGFAAEWDVDQHKAVLSLDPRRIGLDSHWDNRSRFSADGKTIATIFEGAQIWRLRPPVGTTVWTPTEGRVWTAEQGKQFEEAASLQDDNVITDLQFSADSQRALTRADHNVKVWDLTAGPRVLLGTTADRAVLSPDGRRLLTIDENRGVKIWDIYPNQELARVPGRGAIFGSEAGTLASIAQGSGSVELWNIETGGKLRTLLEAANVSSIALSGDGRTLAGITPSGMEVWDIRSQRKILSLTYSASPFSTLAFSPSEPLILGTPSRGVAGWDTRTGTQLWFLDEGDESRGDSPKWHEGVCRASLQFSTDGRYFLTFLDGVAKLRRSTNQQLVMTVTSTSAIAYCSAALSPDGQQVALGTEDGEIEIWDTAHPRRLSHAKAHRQATVSIAFDPGRHRLASGGMESVDQYGLASSVKVWDLNALAPLLVLEDHADRVWHPPSPYVFNPTGNDAHDFESNLGRRVIFSRDGKLLAVDSSDVGHEDVYSLQSDELLRLARTRLSSPLPLSSGECQTYLHEEQCPRP